MHLWSSVSRTASSSSMKSLNGISNLVNVFLDLGDITSNPENCRLPCSPVNLALVTMILLFVQYNARWFPTLAFPLQLVKHGLSDYKLFEFGCFWPVDSYMIWLICSKVLSASSRISRSLSMNMISSSLSWREGIGGMIGFPSGGCLRLGLNKY